MNNKCEYPSEILQTPFRGMDARWVASSGENTKWSKENMPILFMGNLAKLALNTSFSQEASTKNGRYGKERFDTKVFAGNTSNMDILPADYDNWLNHWAALGQGMGEYYGTKATLNVYGLPEVVATQASESMIALSSGPNTVPDDFNLIAAGWHVFPELNGDHDTYFFVAWSVGPERGCFNLDCEGFVWDKSSKYVPGTRIRPLSTYNGEQRYITLKISKDMETGDWWLHAGLGGENPVGYWPKSLFTSLSNNAAFIVWGGVVSYEKGQKSPPMGSGHFPEEGEGKAASLKNIQLISKKGGFYNPWPIAVQDKKDCYQISGDKVVHFGGPGCSD